MFVKIHVKYFILILGLNLYLHICKVRVPKDHISQGLAVSFYICLLLKKQKDICVKIGNLQRRQNNQPTSVTQKENASADSYIPYKAKKLLQIQYTYTSPIKIEIPDRECVRAGAAGSRNPQIFGTPPFAPADFVASSTMCTRCFENQSSPGCTCTRRSKFLTHSLHIHVHQQPGRHQNFSSKNS